MKIFPRTLIRRLQAQGAVAFLLPFSILGQTKTAATPRHPLPIRFIDSATGYAIQPDSLTTRAHRPDAVTGPAESWGSTRAGRAILGLERGRHTITAVSSAYKPMSGEFEMLDGNPFEVRFFLDPLVEPAELRADYITSLQRADSTIILGFVVDDDSGEPLPDVRVSSAPSGAEARGDGRGFFQLYVPVQGETPAGLASSILSFSKPGFQAEERQFLELWPNGDWTYRIRLSRGTGKQIVDERQFRRRPAFGQAAPAPPGATSPTPAPFMPSVQPQDNNPNTTALTNSTIRVPRNIRVLESNGTTIDYDTLDFYCRRVLPAEWFSSWGNQTGGSNSLNAGAVALRTYAIGYINNPFSTTADICGTTSCQAYGTATSANADTAVNFTANYVMVNSSTAIPKGLTEYSAENNSLNNSCGDAFTEPSTTGPVCIFDPVCALEPRNGHGRGMCQWGTAKWATGLKYPGNSTGNLTTTNGFPRRDWTWICQHYYPALKLVKGAPLILGDDIKALVMLNVRACPDGSITNGINCGLVTTRNAGDTGTIIGGPTLVTNDNGGFTWYQVQWSDSMVGWSAENYLERVFSLPTAPTGLTATPNGTNQISLSWTNTSSPVEAGFYVERAIASGGPWLQISSVGAGTTAYSDKNLYGGSAWYYRVRAYNAGGPSAYSNIASATTSNTPPVLTAVGPRTITEGALLLVTNTATAPDFVRLLTDFEPFMTEITNGFVLFRDPTNSPTTAGFLAPTNELSVITDVFPTTGNSSARALRIACNVTGSSNPWLRLTTAGAGAFPNPVIDFTGKLRFSIYADKAIQVAVGCRETVTPAGTALGSNGGTSGNIEWAGVTNTAGTAPMPTRTVPAGAWTTLTFDFPHEPITSFSGGNGVLSTASGLGVLEHLAIVPGGGTGLYNVYLDNFAVLAPRTLTYSLGPGAPSGTSINSTNGVFAWTPTDPPGPGTYNIPVIVTDNNSPPLSGTNTFTVTVAPPPSFQAVSVAGTNVTLNWSAVSNATYRLQFKNDLSNAVWQTLGPDITATNATATVVDPGFGATPQRFYRLLLVN